MTSLKFYKFISRYELEPIYSVSGDQKLHYIIDIYLDDKQFFPRVSRRDYFCIYPAGIKELCEEELFVVDEVDEWEKIKGTSEDDVLKKVKLKIENKLGIKA